MRHSESMPRPTQNGIHRSYPVKITDVESNSSYVCLDYLGSGSFGDCCLLRALSSKKLYAGKFVGTLENPNENVCRTAEKEATIHKELKHVNIVEFMGYFGWKGCTIYLLEYCPFGTLLGVLKRRKALTEIEARYYIEQILRGLSYLFKKSIVHGDIKPANIFLTRDMKIKIGDFGLSMALGNKTAVQSSCHGTPNYMSPEMFKGSYGCPADVWAAGCTLYFLLCNNTPFQANDLPQTIDNVLACRYFPYIGIRRQTVNFLRTIFQTNPEFRPRAEDLLKNKYFTKNFIPVSLPKQCLMDEPNMALLGKQYRQKNH